MQVPIGESEILCYNVYYLQICPKAVWSKGL
jgi:hypothetical protein